MAGVFQITGNAGVFYVGYMLSLKGWHVMPTVRNAKGPDLICSRGEGNQRTYASIQVKTTNGHKPFGLGIGVDKVEHPDFDWLIGVVLDQKGYNEPTTYVLDQQDVLAHATYNMTKDGMSRKYWIDPHKPSKGGVGYRRDEFRNAWHRLEDEHAHLD